MHSAITGTCRGVPNQGLKADPPAIFSPLIHSRRDKGAHVLIPHFPFSSVQNKYTLWLWHCRFESLWVIQSQIWRASDHLPESLELIVFSKNCLSTASQPCLFWGCASQRFPDTTGRCFRLHPSGPLRAFHGPWYLLNLVSQRRWVDRSWNRSLP